MSKIRLSILLIISIFLNMISVNDALAEEFRSLSSLEMLGGRSSIEYSTTNLANWQPDGLKLTIEINYGHFFIDNLALTFDLSVLGKLTNGAGDSERYTFGPGLLYLFELTEVYRPYVQFSPQVVYQKTGWSLGFIPRFGLLVRLSEYVAIDLGVDSRLEIPIQRDTPTSIQIGIGYFGMKAFI